MRMVEVIIPTLRKVHAFSCFENLRHIPWSIRLHVITRGKTWAEAINIGLSQTSPENDVILMDDDVFINNQTFFSLDSHYDDADIFGFKLMFPEGKIQHFGGIVTKDRQIGHVGWGDEDREQYQNPIYACHATTSLVYIKRHVLNELKGMAEDIPGVQCEDVDFSFRALKKGYRIIILPEKAIHLQSASKKFIPQFDEKVGLAFQEIVNRHLQDNDFLGKVCSYPKPFLKVEVPA